MPDWSITGFPILLPSFHFSTLYITLETGRREEACPLFGFFQKLVSGAHGDLNKPRKTLISKRRISSEEELMKHERDDLLEQYCVYIAGYLKEIILVEDHSNTAAMKSTLPKAIEMSLINTK